VSRELLLRLAISQPPNTTARCSVTASTCQLPAVADSGFGGRGGPSGQAPSAEKHVKTMPTKSQKNIRVRSERAAPPSPTRWRRQSAKRSTLATKNGTSRAISTSSIAQPRTIRWPNQM
jgi:hypothetical protein